MQIQDSLLITQGQFSQYNRILAKKKKKKTMAIYRMQTQETTPMNV